MRTDPSPRATGAPGSEQAPDLSGVSLLEQPWRTLLWDDPVNVCEYVTMALVSVLRIDKASAEQLMLEAHHNGRAPVFEGERSAAEEVAVALHGWHLQASVERVP